MASSVLTSALHRDRRFDVQSANKRQAEALPSLLGGSVYEPLQRHDFDRIQCPSVLSFQSGMAFGQ
jgi:hypothetical protein